MRLPFAEKVICSVQDIKCRWEKLDNPSLCLTCPYGVNSPLGFNGQKVGGGSFIAFSVEVSSEKA